MPAAYAQQAPQIPQVSSNDLYAFHEAHFSQDAISHFSGTFLRPTSGTGATPSTEALLEEDDDLGYYEDGVKRTLTDEQIEIFRHSELQQLRKAQERKATIAGSPTTLSEGELSDARKSRGNATMPAQNGPKRKKRKTAKQPREPKPDLRKRTWDVVEAGLDTLEYD